MPYCSKQTLERWLAEFHASGSEQDRAYVAEQEAVDGCDGGLVIFPLTTSTASVYVQPTAPGSLDWQVTIEAHPEDTTLTAERLRRLCRELSLAAILCDHLQERALALHARQNASGGGT